MKNNIKKKNKLKDEILDFLEARKSDKIFYSLISILPNTDEKLAELIKNELAKEKLITVNESDNKSIIISHEGSKFLEKGGYNGNWVKNILHKYKNWIKLFLGILFIIQTILFIIQFFFPNLVYKKDNANELQKDSTMTALQQENQKFNTKITEIIISKIDSISRSNQANKIDNNPIVTTNLKNVDKDGGIINENRKKKSIY